MTRLSRRTWLVIGVLVAAQLRFLMLDDRLPRGCLARGKQSTRVCVGPRCNRPAAAVAATQAAAAAASLLLARVWGNGTHAVY